ncbi:MAG TPA: hypothetical protein PLR99_29775, partial [Polyangiaceae bacterium]|nr:hypothetical protein [Polyangiaceae bacterium]
LGSVTIASSFILPPQQGQPSHDRRPERRTSRREPQGRAVPHDEMKLARGDHSLPPRTARR